MSRRLVKAVILNQGQVYLLRVKSYIAKGKYFFSVGRGEAKERKKSPLR